MEKVVDETTLMQFYKNKKVFLTGHTGFKGLWLLCWLNKMGAIIKGYSLSPENNIPLFNSVKENIEFDNIFADIRDLANLKKEIEDFQPDVIFHLAAQALVRTSYDSPAETFEINSVGTANILEAIITLKKKCTVIIITTDKVYENREQDYHYNEDDILGGYDPYSASKAAAEIVVSSFRNSFFNSKNYHFHRKKIITARAGNVIGGGDFSKDRIIPDIIRSLKNDTDVHVRNPNAVRPWQHVLEPLNGYLLLAMLADKNEQIVSNAYNFGPFEDDHLSVLDLVKTAIQKWGNGTWKDNSNINEPHEAGLLKLDINKAINELNWKPKLNSKQAIEWTINWYKVPAENNFNFTMEQIKKYQSL
jgi:CDP-glucose 4,6-dehydratase